MSRTLLQKLKPYYIRKALRYLKHYGPKDFLIRVRERLTPEEVPYGPWFEAHRASDAELERQRTECRDAGAVRAAEEGGPSREPHPLFSVIVPAWHTPERFLRQLLDCVLGQTWQDLELVIANASPEDEDMRRILAAYASGDSRLRVIDLPENVSIASNTNATIAAASGEFICFMDHDDLIAPDALYEASKYALRKDIDLIYTDEDKIRDDGNGGPEHFQPHFKPDFNLDLLRSNNYICHFLMVRRSLVMTAGGPDERFEGAQDYEFILRCIDRIGPERIAHVPKVLYHWRTHAASTADNPDSKAYAYDAGKRALEEHLERRGVRGSVSQTKDHGFYRVRYELTEHPMVSVIIPNREQRPMLEKCLQALRAHTQYDNYEVIVVENNSSSKEILDYYRQLREEDHVRVIRWKKEFNFAAINNFASQRAKGEYLVFLNNDVEVRDGWLTELVSVCARPEVGAAGGKLYYPDGRIQSAGIAVGIGGVAGSLFTGMTGSFSGYLHKASILQDLSAVTAAMMIVKREAFERAGGFTEALAVAFNDVDLCLKLREAGYLTVYDPYAEATHHESVSRGDEYTARNAQRYREEAAYMKERWAEYYRKGDPCYNPNFSLARWDYTLSMEKDAPGRREPGRR